MDHSATQMTHYMELLMINQPWNLLIFMAGVIVLAESLAITELILLYGGGKPNPLAARINKIAGALGGVYFLGIIIYLIPKVIGFEWRGIIDIVAVICYLLSGIPLILVALQDFKVLHKNASDRLRLGWRVAFVAVFLVVSHLAMIAGMADPSILGGGNHAQTGMPAMEMDDDRGSQEEDHSHHNMH
ncbi:MAG: cytochrome oxidase biogenesis protein Surf12C [Helicobacteraceae bacterium]|jgi:hypothetical protein|nr:cytochrome oxidase biogenesis protein Surf12C [Helicobacteraceae bacterium]